MDEFTPLKKPLQSQVTIDSVAKPCPSDGFNYPSFRLLNKHARIYLSKPISLNLPTSYHLFAVSNLKGWFVAAKQTPSGSVLIFSTLEDLRSAFPGAKEDDEDLFNPKRTLPLQSTPNIVTFAFGDTRMFVGLEDGHVLVYDTSALFSSGTNEIGPVASTQIQRPALRHIVPNPGTEPGLSDLVAIVGHEKVHLFNVQLEPQGGWAATDASSRPVAASWSPRGKHIAVGLEGGDILTFALTKKSAVNKHLPPTSNALLVSLNWLGPGHTFRTSYGATSDTGPVQHIIVLDTKSSTATHFAPDHPFPSSTHDQNAHVLSFPNWDMDSPSNEDHKSLTIVGDVSAVDLEVLGNVGNQWHRQSMDNPVSLPLDKAMDDTTLLALEADLTDVDSTAPIVYTYLSDGSLQGWHLDHSKPYPGLISPGSTNPVAMPQRPEQESGKDSDMGSEQSPFGGSSFGRQTQATSAFGQTGFGQQTTSPFGGQPTSSFGQTGFGPTPVQATSSFGQSSFGQTSTFGSSAFTSTGAFGQANQSLASNSSFSDVKPASGFGAFGSGSSNAFGGGGSGAFSSNSATTHAFSGLVGSNTSVFGQGSFGSASGGASPSHSPTMTREASMSDSTPGFGGLSLGSTIPSDPNAVNSMFGSFGVPATNQPASSAFGGSIKPASGFGAFGNLKTSSAFDKPPTAPTANAFATPPTQPATASGFGQSGFASSSFGKSGFGQQPQQPAFGKPSLGTGPVSGGFGAFANAPTSLSSGAQPQKPSAPTTGGFGAFASAAPSAFGSALGGMAASAEVKPASGGAFGTPPNTGNAFSAFASTTPSPFGSTLKTADEGGSSSTTASPFAPKPAAETATRTSVFGTPTSSFGGNALSPTPAFDTPRKSPFGGSSVFGGGGNNLPSPDGSPQHVVSPPSSPEPSSPRKAAASPFGLSRTPTTSSAATGGAFGNLVATPSAFKPATGFGAFGAYDTSKSSPFFKKPEETTTPTISAFAPISSSATTTSTSAATPTFGSPSALGGVKSTFAPVSPASPTVVNAPITGAFSAFSGSPSGFGAFVGKKTSFSDLLKTGGDSGKDPVKAPAFTTPPAKEEEEEEEVVEKPTKRTSVFGTPASPSAKKEEKTPPVISAFPPIAKAEVKPPEDGADNEKPPISRKVSDEPSYGNISASSATSSFVEVSAEDDAHSDQDAEHSDADSFLSDDPDDPDDASYQPDNSEEEDSSLESGELLDEEDGKSASASPEPADVPLPSSRSASATPQPEPPVIQVSPSPDADAYEAKASPSPPQAREPSTTPPGTPVKEAKALPGPSPTLAHSQPSGLGIGRPSTRPTRSSPLANTVLPADEEEETRPAPPLPIAESPKLTPRVVPIKEAGRDEETNGQPPSKRPKTPPLLSTLSSPASTSSLSGPASASIPLFSVPVARDGAPTTPTPSVFGFGKLPAAAATTGSFFTTTGPSLFGPKPELTRASTAPAASTTAPTSIFGGPPPPSSPKPAFSMPSFSLTGSGTPSPLFPASTLPAHTPSPSPFGLKSQSPPPASGQSVFSLFPSSAPAHPPGSPFGGSKPTGSSFDKPASSIFGAPFSASKQPSAAPAPAPVPTTPTPEAMMGEGMQKECCRLVLILEKEFKELTTKSHMIHTKISTFGNSAGGSRHKADLGDPSKWSLGDLSHFGRVLLKYEADLEELEAYREEQERAKRELHSAMLKAKTRKEEIVRFNKAKNDKEFAKMLKSRSLGPELSETQTHLRKSIRAIRDRVQKLESGLQANKKKLARSTSFKPSFKAPSLDTINRTFRNIEITIDQQSDDVAQLASRIDKLSVEDVARDSLVPLTRDARLPNLNRPRAYNITPSVAATTAAALNAERSAQRLKKALLAVRKEPLLNVKVNTAPSAPVAFSTLKNGDNDEGFWKVLNNTTGSLFGEPVKTESIPVGVWNLPPDDNFNPTTPSMPHGRRGAGGQRKHQSVPLKRSAGAAPGLAGVPPPPRATTASTPTFDWGPLPSFSTPAPAKVPMSFVPISPTNWKK